MRIDIRHNRKMAAAAAGIICAAGLLLWRGAGASARPAEQTASDVPAARDRTGFSRKVLSVWQGRLALFEPGARVPSEVYDCFVASLPDGERQKLAEGIPVYDEEQLAQLLEAYLS